MMEAKANVQAATQVQNVAKETSAATTADGGISTSYSCGYATIHEGRELLKEAGRGTVDFLKWLAEIALTEKHREDDAKQERYLARQNKQAAFADKARANAMANAMIKRAEADEKKAEADIAKSNVQMKDLELRERAIAIREKELGISEKAKEEKEAQED